MTCIFLQDPAAKKMTNYPADENGGSAMPLNEDDPYVQLEISLTDLLTESDRFIEGRLALAAARARVNKDDVRYWRAIESAFSLLDSPCGRGREHRPRYPWEHARRSCRWRSRRSNPWHAATVARQYRIDPRHRQHHRPSGRRWRCRAVLTAIVGAIKNKSTA
jgi:hypothetical protein